MSMIGPRSAPSGWSASRSSRKSATNACRRRSSSSRGGKPTRRL
jgi:hypothetical protein